MGKNAALKFGNPALTKHDCARCGDTQALHVKNICNHCGHDRSRQVAVNVELTKRQINALRGFRAEGNAR